MFVMFILFDVFSSEPPAPQRGAKEDDYLLMSQHIAADIRSAKRVENAFLPLYPPKRNKKYIISIVPLYLKKK